MKKIISVLFALMLVVTTFSGITVVAATEVGSGKCGENVYWSVDSEKTLTISGTGAMYDFTHTTCEYVKYDIKKIVIEEGIEEIGNWAFECFYNLEEVSISNTVKVIGLRSFSECSSLKEVVIPESVTSILNYAFDYCNSLEKISVEEGNEVYHSAGNCVIESETGTVIIGIGSSVIPSDNTVSKIGDYAFSGYSKTTDFVIPEGITEIGEYAFSNFEGVKKLTLPISLTSIGENAFGDYMEEFEELVYKGTKSDWDKIEIDDGNDAIIDKYVYKKPELVFEKNRLTVEKNDCDYVKVGVAYIGENDFLAWENWNEFIAKGKKYTNLNGSSGYVLYNNNFEGKTYKTLGNYVAFVKYVDAYGEWVSYYKKFRVLDIDTEFNSPVLSFDTVSSQLTVDKGAADSYKVGISYIGINNFSVADENWDEFINKGKLYSHNSANGSAGYVLYKDSYPTKIYKTPGNYVGFIKYVDTKGATRADYMTFNIASEEPYLSYDNETKTITVNKAYADSVKVGVAYVGNKVFDLGKCDWDEFVRMGQVYSRPFNGIKGYQTFVGKDEIKLYTKGNYCVFIKYTNSSGKVVSKYMNLLVS